MREEAYSVCDRHVRDEAAQFAAASRVEREIAWVEYVTRASRSDELALAALFQETYALVFATALRIVGFRADAEEVAADVYARVWMTAATFDAHRGSVGAWLVRIARNGAIDRFRARAVRSRSEAALLLQCHSGDDPDAIIDGAQTKARLQQALQSLPFEQRRAIELFYFSELTVTDISERLGHPIGTVKTRLRLGLLKLRRLLAPLAGC